MPAPKLLPALALATAFVAAPTITRADPGPLDAIAADVRAGKPLVLYVVVPLCSNEQINCGSGIAGRPAGLEHNVYWGAAFGARRFFERPKSGWERVERTRGEGIFLERGVYRRFVAGAPWGRAEDVEEIVVLQAIHGDAIDRAVDHLWQTATGGGRVTFHDGDRKRDERILVAGYAGHNRLMDGKTLPPASAGAPVPSFVLACKSEPYFGPSLRSAGSMPLVTTSTLMAPEGYLIDAIARGIGEKLDPAELRKRAVAAYAKWQKLTPRQAGSVFAKR
ncbi:MAG: hypothetical protein QM820_35405 [Minicystis sp.]